MSIRRNPQKAALILIIVGLIGLSLFRSAFAQSPPIAPATSTSQQAGQAFWIDIMVGSQSEPVSDLFGVSFELGYNDTVLSVTGDVRGSFLGSDVVYFASDDGDGTVGVGISRKAGAGGVGGHGSVARVQFVANADTPDPTEVDFTLSNIQATDPDGSSLSLNPQVLQVTISGGPKSEYDLTVRSADPSSGIAIEVGVEDNNGERDGTTEFTRTYDTGTQVTLTAPEVAPNDNQFKHWLLDGGVEATSQSVTVTVDNDHVATAVYEILAPQLRVTPLLKNYGSVELGEESSQTFTIENSGTVPLAGSATLVGDDLDAFLITNGEGNFLLDPGQTWQVQVSFSPNSIGTMNAEISLAHNGINEASPFAVPLIGTGTAPVTTQVLTVRSADPSSGIAIEVGVEDNNGERDGTTEFTRTYDTGTQVTLTAPEVAPNNNQFKHWLLDGQVQTTNRTMTLTLNIDRSIVAVYVVPPPVEFRLTVSSEEPSRNVVMDISPDDNDGDSEGTTTFTRTYNEGTTVTLRAPEVAPNGNQFKHWLVSGKVETVGLSLVVKMDGDYRITAIYEEVPPPPEEKTLESEMEEKDGSLVGTLRWAPVSGADAYHLQVANDTNFGPRGVAGKVTAVLVDTVVTVAPYNIGEGPLQADEIYYWRVRSGKTPVGPWSAWTSAQELLVEVSTSIDQAKAEGFKLEQNYPNPFNPATVIAYEVPTTQRVVLKVFDLLSREIGMLVNEVQAAGRHEIVFEAQDLPSGVYFYQMEAGGFVKTQRLIIAK